MIYRFIMISDEIGGFKREFKINSDDTFLSLHRTIMESVSFEENEKVSFFTTSDSWDRKQEITLEEVVTYSDVDSYTMAETSLDEFLEDEKQRLVYVFDQVNDRVFFMELREMIPGEEVNKPICSQSEGNSPVQFIEVEEAPVVVPTVATLFNDESEEFFGEGPDSDDYDEDDLKDLDDLEEDDLPTDEEIMANEDFI